jgi:O-antigen ligase
MLDNLRQLNPWRMPLPQRSRPLFNTRQLRHLLIVAVTLLLAYNFGRRPSLIYVYLPVVLVALWLIYKSPGFGLFCMLAATLLVPFALGTGTQSSINITLLAIPLLLGLWLVAMVWDRHIQLAPSATNLPLAGLITAISISFLVGYLPWNVFAQLAPVRAQLGEWAIFVFSAGAFWLMANRLGDIRWLKRMVWLFLALGCIYVASRLMGRTGNRIGSLFSYGSTTGSQFWIWLVALAAGQVLFNRDLSRAWRVALLALVAATFAVALAAGDPRSWTSGWLPAAFALGLLVWFRWPRGSLLLGVALALIGILFLPALRELLYVPNQYSLLTRNAAFSIVLEIIKVNPLLGVGPANYYYYTPLYPILGYYIQFNSHNQYVDIVAQTGLIGLLFFGWWALATARVGWSLRKKFADGFALGYIYAALAGLAAMMLAGALGDWLLPFVYNIGLTGFRGSVLGWLFLGGLVALEQIARQAAAATETA